MSSNSSVPLFNINDIDINDIDMKNMCNKKIVCEQEFKRELIKVLKEISRRLYSIEVEIANK